MNQTLLGSESSPSNPIAAASYDYEYYDYMNKFTSPLDSNTKHETDGTNKDIFGPSYGSNTIKRNDYGHSGYGDSESYGYGHSGGYGYGHQNNIKLNIGQDFKIKVPSIPKKVFGFPFSTMFSGISKLSLRIPNIKLGVGLGFPDLQICPDIILAGLVVAAAVAAFVIYQAITVKGRRRKRGTDEGLPFSYASLVPQILLIGTL